MLSSGWRVLAAAVVSLSGVIAAPPTLTGTTWTGDACMIDFLFGPDGRFGEYNDGGENHYGQWEMDGNVLYLVYDDMSYQQAEFRDGAFSVAYYDGPGESHSCEFRSSL